jgi:suppressor of fused
MNLQSHSTAQESGTDMKSDAGRVAITASLNTLYKGRKPKHYENPHPWELGGPDPLEGISVWQRAEPIPHWHYVTYGFSEQGEKKSGTTLSGFGFELTFRLAASQDSKDPPIWPIHLLQNLGRYVYRTGYGFQDGHRLDANGPISHDIPTLLHSLGFVPDPELPPINTINGTVEFIQVVGLTQDESAAAQRWETRRVMTLLRPYMPLFITHLKRGSIMKFAAVANQVNDGIRREGSATGVVLTDLLEVKATKRFWREPLASIRLGARQIEQLIALLPLRLKFERPFSLSGPGWTARRNSWRIERGLVCLCVTKATVEEIATLLQVRQGVYKLPSFPNILWDVKQTTIRNAEGEIVDIVG